MGAPRILSELLLLGYRRFAPQSNIASMSSTTLCSSVCLSSHLLLSVAGSTAGALTFASGKTPLLQTRNHQPFQAQLRPAQGGSGEGHLPLDLISSQST